MVGRRHQSRLAVEDHGAISAAGQAFRPLLVDSAGVVLAAPPDQAEHDRPAARQRAAVVGHRLQGAQLPTPIRARFPLPTTDGSKRAIQLSRAFPGTQSRLVVSIDEAKVTAAINREIRTAYLQLGFVCLFVLLGALIGAEKLIIQPIEDHDRRWPKRFGEGDSSARVSRSRLPAEFMPLARAFNAMAAQLSQRGARTGRHQRPPHRDGLDRHAVRPRQPPRLPEPARFRMDEGAATSAASCRC